MMPVLMLGTVAGITSVLVIRRRQGRIMEMRMASGAISLAFGLATSVALTAHLLTVLLRVLVEREQPTLLLPGVAVLIPGLFCIAQAGALTRGELHAQQRTLAAAVVVLGFTLPTSVLDPLAGLLSGLALANIIAVLYSRTDLELSARRVSSHY
jgi:hypothetical protein